MNSKHTTQLHIQPPADPTEVIKIGLTTWHALAVDLPLRLTAETMRFASLRLQAQTEHLSALTRCGSIMDLVKLQAAFVTKGVTDYQTEATALSHDVTEAALAKAA